jgi:hypothetical protein
MPGDSWYPVEYLMGRRRPPAYRGNQAGRQAGFWKYAVLSTTAVVFWWREGFPSRFTLAACAPLVLDTAIRTSVLNLPVQGATGD